MKRVWSVAKLTRPDRITAISMLDRQKNQISVVNLEQAYVPDKFKLQVDRMLKRYGLFFVKTKI